MLLEGGNVVFTQSNSGNSLFIVLRFIWLHFKRLLLLHCAHVQWKTEEKPEILMTIDFLSFFQMRRWLVMLLWELLIVDIAPALHSPVATHWTTIISHKAPGLFAYSTQWPLHCGGVQCFTASCFFSFAFTVHKVSYHGVAWQKVVLMWFWSTFQEATYYSAYECVEFISTHCCSHTKAAKALMWQGCWVLLQWLYPWSLKNVFQTLTSGNPWTLADTFLHFKTTLKWCVRVLTLKPHNCSFSARWSL